MRAIASSPTRLAAEAAADDDAFRVPPGLLSQEPPDDLGELLRELLDRALHDAGSLRRAFGKELIEFLLRDLLGRLVAEGSSPSSRKGWRHFQASPRTRPGSPCRRRSRRRPRPRGCSCRPHARQHRGAVRGKLGLLVFGFGHLPLSGHACTATTQRRRSRFRERTKIAPSRPPAAR